MNYIAQINAFQECILEYELKPQEISLWYALMAVCNRTGWMDEFSASKKKLALMSGLSESSVLRARKRLEEAGFITFSANAGRQPATYHMNDISVLRRRTGQTGAIVQDAAVHGQSAEDMPGAAVHEYRPEVGVSKTETATFARQSDAQSEAQSDTLYINNKQKQYSLSFSLSARERGTDVPDTDVGDITVYSQCLGMELMFDRFWKAYPSSASERNAREAYAYAVLVKGVPEPDLLGAAQNYATHCRLAGVMDRYIKHASNWLREEVYVEYLPGNWKENIVEYKKPAAPNKSGSGGIFSNAGRDYDFDELERQLLAGGN